STLTLIDDILNTWGRLDVWVCSSGLLGPASITETTPSDLQKCWEANALGPFFALKYAPPAMGKLCEKRNYTNSEVKDQGYGSIIVVGSVAGGYGGCWGPCYTMSSHAALGAVRSGVAVLKARVLKGDASHDLRLCCDGKLPTMNCNVLNTRSPLSAQNVMAISAGTGVRINHIAPGQIDVGVDLKNFDMRGMTAQLPPASLQSKEHANIGLERAGLPTEIARVSGFLASGFSSYITGANLVVDGGAS
ncbi:MAG: hypothetical protein Q9210_007058, partial [Variospora velana]